MSISRPDPAVAPVVPSRAGLWRNVGWLSVANLAVKPIWFVFLTVLCMRFLSVAEYGRLTASLAAAAILTAFGDLGTTEWTTRAVAQAPGRASAVLSSVVAGRLVLGAILLTAVGVAGWAGLLRAGGTGVLVAACGYVLALRTVEAARGFFRGIEVMRLEAWTIVAERLLVVGGGAVALVLTRHATGTLVGMLVGVLSALLGTLLWIHYHFAPLSRVSATGWTRLYRDALPLGGVLLVTMVLANVGSYFVLTLRGPYEAGLYGVPARLVEMLMLLPAIGVASLLPRLSALHAAGDVARYRRVLTHVLLAFGAGSAVIAAVVSAAGPVLVGWLAGSDRFADAGQFLRLYVWVFPVMGLNYLTAAALVAAHDQRFLLLNVGGWCAVMLGALALSVPRHGYYAIGVVAPLVFGGVSLVNLVRLYRPLPPAP